jgi:hypothetical protein
VLRSVFVVSIVLVPFLGLALTGTTNVAASGCAGGATAGRAAGDYITATVPLPDCLGGGDPGHGSDGNGYHGGPSNSTDPNMGPVGTAVRISTTLSPGDTSCTVASSTLGLVTASSCSMSGGNVKAGFVVGNVPAGTYLVQISGNHYGDYTTLTFTVQS